jgi:hypothetical protein
MMHTAMLHEMSRDELAYAYKGKGPQEETVYAGQTPPKRGGTHKGRAKAKAARRARRRK